MQLPRSFLEVTGRDSPLKKRLPARLQLPLSALCTGETTAFLVALFFDGCCQLFNPDNLQTTVFKIPLRTFFAFLPLCYGGILIVVLRKARKSRWLTAAAALGALFGIFAASGLSYYMLDADIPGSFTYFITGHVTSKYVFLMLMNLLLLLVGCLMDMYSAILIVSPLLLPIAESFGISAVQAGVIFLLNLSIGFLTPPVGMDLFIASYTFKRTLGKIVRGVLPFLGVQLLVLLFVTYMPWLSL